MTGDLDGVRAGLNALDQRVASGRFGAARPWGGAGVVIRTEPLPDDGAADFYPSPRAVITPHVGPLSWLFEELWRVFRPVLGRVDKFEFFGRLANAATRYQAQIEGDGTERDLLGAALHEAYAILSDMAGDTFNAPHITSGNAIHDDAVPDAERPRYISVEEADRWLAEPDQKQTDEPSS